MKLSKDNGKLIFVVQSLRYIVTGAVSFLTDYSIYLILSSFVHYQFATYTGLFAGLAVNYVLSKAWVFGSKSRINTFELVSFGLFTAFGFALTGICMYAGVELLGYNDKIVRFAVSVFVFAVNFIARKYIIFKN